MEGLRAEHRAQAHQRQQDPQQQDAQPQPQPRPAEQESREGMTREQAERLLDSLSEEEQENLRRQLQAQQGGARRKEKDW